VGGVTGGGNGSDENVASDSRSHVGRSLDEKRQDAGGGPVPGAPVRWRIPRQLQCSSPAATIGSPPVVIAYWAERVASQARWRWAVWPDLTGWGDPAQTSPPTTARLAGLCLCQRLPHRAALFSVYSTTPARSRLQQPLDFVASGRWRCRLAVRRRNAVHWCRCRRIGRPPTVRSADGRPSALRQPTACLPHCRRLCSGSAASTAHLRPLSSSDILAKPPHQRRLRLAGMACVHYAAPACSTLAVGVLNASDIRATPLMGRTHSPSAVMAATLAPRRPQRMLSRVFTED